MKRLSDYPAYVECHDGVKRAEAELQRIDERRSEIQETLLGMKRSKQETGDEWDVFQAGGGSAIGVSTAETELKEEYRDLEEKEKFVTKALKQGRLELGKLHGSYSREICQSVRPQFVVQIRRILTALKEVCEANEVLGKLRGDLEAAGIRTDSLAAATCNIGSFDDPYGSTVSFYRQYIMDQYPELEPVNGLRRQLAENILSFEKQEEA
jgi:hypothetical protein